MPPAVTVREARTEDLDTIVDFNARLALESEGKVLDRPTLSRGVASALSDRDRLRYWVAEDRPGSVVGQAAITREWSDWRAGWIWWLQSVYVHPDFRGRGTFRALHDEIRSTARATPDVIGLRLYVEVSNDRARRVYQSLGMKPGGYDVYEDLWIGPPGEVAPRSHSNPMP